MKIFICAAFDKKKSMDILPLVISELNACGAAVLMSEMVRIFYKDDRVIYKSTEALGECDMLLTIGGDGTILKWSKRAALAGKPLAGINTGRLGFMTTLDGSEIKKLGSLVKGDYTISERMMLSVSVENKNVKNNAKDNAPILNDVVVMKGYDSKLPEYIVKINGAVVTTIRADGLIFSTPTGSTAYALAAGGPIIAPDVECIQMTPMCAHTLLSRPMIFGGNDTVTLSCRMYEGSSASYSLDGGARTPINEGDDLVIRRSDTVLKLVNIDSGAFFTAVSDKLMTPIK